MKAKKLDLIAFKLNELRRENISNIKAGWPINGKPPGASSGSGSGTDTWTCYYDVDGTLEYCESSYEPNPSI